MGGHRHTGGDRGVDLLLTNCVSLCLQVMEVDTGPGSVREQIKMINEKFAGAAGSQWQNQEPGSQRRDGKEQLGDFFGGSNSYAECYPAT
ncbi:protein Red-like [Seriola lalandi dorsalis]|uniref:protein Red-like n=1 Tax=Seriola lalandi dorsalis TaxID=1841481 RepID=UPI000C6F44AC|nr:protein Red-like [Seriola lalandi dorsalis]